MFRYFFYGYFEAKNQNRRVNIKLPIQIESERELIDLEADSNMLGYCINADENNHIHQVMSNITKDVQNLFHRSYGYKVRKDTDLCFAFLYDFERSRFRDANSYESTMIKLNSDDIENVIPFFMLNRISEKYIIKL